MRIGGGRTVSITDQNIAASETDPADADARYLLNSNGKAQYSLNLAAYVDITGEWLLGGVNSDYEARFTPTIGTLTSGPTGWNVLSTSREWAVERTSSGSKSCTGTLEIRNATSLAVLDTATIVLSATVL